MRKICASYSICFFIFYCLIVQKVIGQHPIIIDSLFKELQITKTVSGRIDILNELAWEYRIIETKKGQQFAETALKLSDSINSISGKITSLSRLGTIKIYQNDYNSAEEIFKNLLALEKESNHLYGVGRANNQLGRIYKEQGKLIKSIKYRLESLKLFEQIKDSNQIALVLNNLGETYRELREFELAIKYLTKSVTIHKHLNNYSSANITVANLGILFSEIGSHEKGIELLNDSKNYFIEQGDYYRLLKVYIDLGMAYMRLENYDLSLDYFKKAMEMNMKMGLEQDAAIYNNLGILYNKKNNLSRAFDYYQKSISAQTAQDTYYFLDARINIAGILYKQKKYREAINYLEEALKLTDSYEKAVSKLKIYNDLSDCYAAIQNDKKALEYRNEYLKLDESIRSSLIKAIQFESAYNEAQKEIEILKTSNQLAKTQLEKLDTENTLKQTQVLALSAVLVIASLLFFFIYSAIKLKAKAKLADRNKKVAEKNRELEVKNVHELLNNQEIRYNQARLEEQEKERTRIAKDLHDGLGSLLSTIKIYYISVEEQIDSNNSSSKKQYLKANKLLDKACEEVRKISHEIHSGILSKFGLIAALEDLVETINNSKQIHVELNTHGISDRLNNDLQINVYRIIQELMNNILKHANASEVSIQLIQFENNLTIMVEDNGKGFKYNKENSSGMGLKNIQSRVDKLNGEIDFDSTLGKGTTTTLNLPLKEI